MADTPTGETVVVDDSKTQVTPPVTPPVVKTEDNAVEELRKQLQQQEMRANQLANQLKAKEDAEAATKAKELEDQNQFKELHEQEKAKREALEADIAAKDNKAKLEEAKQTALKEYSDEVKAIVEETGMDLADSDETTVAAFKEKVEKINARLGTAKVSPNNPNSSSKKSELSGEDLRVALRDKSKFHEIVMGMPGIAAMTKPKAD